MRRPLVTGGRRPVLAAISASVRRERRAPDPADGSDRRVARIAATNAMTTTNAAMPTTPAPRTSPSTRTPGAGSARRAMPIGNIDDAATATPVAMTTPPTAISSILSPNVAMRCRRVKPSAANVGWSMSVCETSRESTIAIATAPASAATPAKTQSARVSTLIASLPPCDSAESILHRRELRSEHPPSSRSHPWDAGGAVARAYPQDRREDRDPTLVRAIEGRGLDDDAARSREITQVERPPDDADDPQPYGRAGRSSWIFAMGDEHELGRRDRGGVEMISEPEMLLRSKTFADRDLVGCVRIGGPAGDDPSAVDRSAQPAVDRGGVLQVGPTPRDERIRVQNREVRDLGDATKGSQLSRRRVSHSDLRVGRPAIRNEPPERGRAAMGTRRRREHNRTNEADQQRHRECAPPAAPELAPSEHENGRHHATMTLAQSRSQVDRPLRARGVSTLPERENAEHRVEDRQGRLLHSQSRWSV